jgi:hypothetical protein
MFIAQLICRSRNLWLIGLSIFSGVALCDDAAYGAEQRLDTSDVSFLWPIPTTKAEAEQLIRLDEPFYPDGGPLLSAELFDQFLAIAEQFEVKPTPTSSNPFKIRLDQPGLRERGNWKVAGIRIDPSAPGCAAGIRQKFGSRPQIRLVCQPVLVEGEDAEALDFALHLPFDFVVPPPSPPPHPLFSHADESAVRRIAMDLLELKTKLKAAGVETTGHPLSIHPGFASAQIDLTSHLRTFLKAHLAPARLNLIAFMGVDDPEPWIFFSATRQSPTAPFALSDKVPPIAFSFRPGPNVVPQPVNNQFGKGIGVSTAQLFPRAIRRDLNQPAGTAPELAGLALKDIPDIIANPDIAHVFNTDCVSCHTESSLRKERVLTVPSARAFQQPAGIAGLDPAMLPKDIWNVRNFGWGHPRSGGPQPTIVQRTANESAESAAFLNEHYLPDAAQAHAEGPRPNALTLIMDARDEAHYNELKIKVRGLLANPGNPINHALDELGNVHDARFVFIDRHQQVAVITTYDDDFETYIRLFTRTIGDVFNLILDHVKDTEAMQNPDGKVQVQTHIDEFLKFVDKYDLEAEPPFYSAYPHLRVQDIREMDRVLNAPPPME